MVCTINYYINDYNELMKKHNQKSRLKWDGEKLYLGTNEQFDSDNYQSCLCLGEEKAKSIIKALCCLECFERGE